MLLSQRSVALRLLFPFSAHYNYYVASNSVDWIELMGDGSIYSRLGTKTLGPEDPV
jgi:hypothetical protein